METRNFGNWSRPAMYQENLSDLKVRCDLCPHNCTLNDGKTGICNARINQGGKLYTLVYGNPCSIAVDPIEKKPLFHFHPGSRIYSLATAGCNLHCLNCQNWQISQSSPRILDHYDLSPEEIVRQALEQRTRSIAFTYTEPTVFYEYVIETARIAHENALKTVIVSNGYINQKPLQELCPHLDAANIDLKCFDDAVYRPLTGAWLQPVLDSLRVLRDNGVWLEITNLLIPKWTDNSEMIQRMCKWLVENGFSETPLHFSRFFPNYKLTQLPPTEETTLLEAMSIAESAGMKYVYVGNIPGLHGENTICPSCRRVVIERLGYAVKHNAVMDGKCSYCGEKIAGVW